MRIWTAMVFDQELTPEEQVAAEAALMSALADRDYIVDGKLDTRRSTDIDDAHVSPRGAGFGWVQSSYGDDDQAYVFERLKAALPADVSFQLTLEYADCDEPGVDVTYHGPRRYYMEVENLRIEIEDKQKRIERLLEEAAGLPASV